MLRNLRRLTTAHIPTGATLIKEIEEAAKRAQQFEDAYYHEQNRVTFRRQWEKVGTDKNGNPTMRMAEEEPFKPGKPYYPQDNDWATRTSKSSTLIER